ncbi:multidrug and toxin extrusion protein 2-like isoform X4 [Sagmatias obliquidens]|uniref:multidrug and toxin extrusion protein 2-like isoform X4 n=1 Tax=Sagmatias obliquidens TaxID=3371155 RepID=UPI000F44206B|nr:multidrug and toxin extrusion protein 2-like isoform X4 [Lagenorhynchus obliquidens]
MYPGSGSSSGPGPGQLSLAHPPPRATCCRDQTLPLKRARAAGGESPGGKDSPLTSSARAHGRGLQLSGAHSPAGLSSGGPGLTVGLAATHPQGDLAGALAPGGGGRCLPHRELLASQARRADGGWGSANSCCCPSSFGSPNRKHVGVILQRGALVLLLCCFPCWALFLNTQHILLLCRQDPAVSRLAQEYVHVYIPALPANFLYSLLAKYLQNQGIMWPQVLSGVVGNCVNGLANYILVSVLGLGVRGSACANTVSQFTQAVFLLLCVVKKKLHLDTWAGWSSQCLQGWGPFFRLAVPSMLMTCIEWWAYEIGSFLMVFPFFITPHTQRRDPDPVTPGQGSPGGLEPKRERPLLHLPLETTGPLAPERGACCQPRAVGWPAGHSPCPPPPPGRLSVLDLSAQAIIYEVATVVYMIPMGLSIAVCFRVGTALGAADTVQAKRSAVSGTLCTVGTSLVVGTLLSLLRSKLGHIFTNDEEVVALVSKVLPLYVVFHLFEAVCCLYGGVLRGTGRQAFGAVVNAVTYYVIGLPLGVVLTFVVGLGITGLWLGMLACVCLAAAAFVTYTACMDWKRAAEEVQKRVELPPQAAESTAPSLRPGPERAVVSSVATGSYPGVTLTMYSRPEAHLDLFGTPEAAQPLPAPPGRLSAKQLAIRRGAALGAATGMLVVGLVIRVLTARP